VLNKEVVNPVKDEFIALLAQHMPSSADLIFIILGYI